MSEWTRHFGGSDVGDTAVDDYGTLTDGTGADNIWSAHRANSLAESIKQIERTLRGDASGKDLTATGTAKINADKLDSYDASDFYKVGDSINATTLGGIAAASFALKAPTNFSIQRGIVVDSTTGNSAFTYAESFGFTYLWMARAYIVIWAAEGAGGAGAAGSTIAVDGTGWTNTGAYAAPYARLPYRPTTGGILFADYTIAPNSIRIAAQAYGTGANLHRVFFNIGLSGIV